MLGGCLDYRCQHFGETVLSKFLVYTRNIPNYIDVRQNSVGDLAALAEFIIFPHCKAIFSKTDCFIVMIFALNLL